jgi:hypothetical protein
MNPTKTHFGSAVFLMMFGATFALTAHASADVIKDETTEREYWGEVVSMNNQFIEFRVNCSGPVQRFSWKGNYEVYVTFTKGCQREELDGWGDEPFDCREWRRGPLFQVGNTGREDLVPGVEFRDGVLTVVAEDGQRFRENSPREDTLRITRICR